MWISNVIFYSEGVTATPRKSKLIDNFWKWLIESN